jgi:Electron transfer DM13
MKKIIIFSISLFVMVMSACTKDQALTPVTQATPANIDPIKPAEATGTFSAGAHPTSGTVKVVVDKTDATKKYLSFENFKTDAGPDLYIYLAEDKNATGSIIVMKLDKTGTFTLDIPSTANLTKQKYVLVWCKQFTVLFGSAKLE